MTWRSPKVPQSEREVQESHRREGQTTQEPQAGLGEDANRERSVPIREWEEHPRPRGSVVRGLWWGLGAGQEGLAAQRLAGDGYLSATDPPWRAEVWPRGLHAVCHCCSQDSWAQGTETQAFSGSETSRFL